MADIGHQLQHERIFGMPAWVALLTLGAAGVVGYLLFFRGQGKKPSGYGTTGYSPYALAVMQNPDVSASISEMNKELFDIGNTIEGGIANLQGAEYSNQAALMSLQGAAYSNQAALGSIQNGITSLQGAATSQQGAEQTYYQSLQNSLQNYANNTSG
jgi:hypothetical protein